MTVNEKITRAKLREMYIEYADAIAGNLDHDYRHILLLQYDACKELAKLLFPKINFDLCEARWFNEGTKDRYVL